MVVTQLGKKSVDFIGAGSFAHELRAWSESGVTNFQVEGMVTGDQLSAVQRDFFIPIGNVKDRYKVVLLALEGHLTPCTLLTHGSAMIANSVKVGRGCLVMDGANIADKAEIGDFVDIHGGAKLGHGVILGSVCSVGANVFIGGETKIGSRVQVFPGALISPGIEICADVTIGIGSVVVRSITKPGTYFGNPAKFIF
jgi:UDP-perosamine 4-acetyltransferase